VYTNVIDDVGIFGVISIRREFASSETVRRQSDWSRGNLNLKTSDVFNRVRSAVHEGNPPVQIGFEKRNDFISVQRRQVGVGKGVDKTLGQWNSSRDDRVDLRGINSWSNNAIGKHDVVSGKFLLRRPF